MLVEFIYGGVLGWLVVWCSGCCIVCRCVG